MKIQGYSLFAIIIIGVIGMAFMSFITVREPKIELPEKWKEISKDSAKPSIIIAYIKYNKLHLEFKH